MISIIIPVYNAQESLEECLKSILSSSYQNFEIIIVDDNSNDKSLEIIWKFKTKKIKVIRNKKNKGAGFSRNRGIKESRGEVLLFIDSDVIVNKNSIAKMIEILKDKDISGVIGIYDKKPCYGNLFGRYKHYVDYFRDLKGKAEQDSFKTAFFAIKKKDLGKIRFNEKFRKASIEDIEFGRKLIKKGKHFVLAKNIKVRHMKKFGFVGFCKNQFFRSGDIANVLLSRKPRNFYLSKKRKNKFAKKYLLRVPVTFFFLLSLLAGFLSPLFILFSFLFILLSIVLEFSFLKFCYHEESPLFLFKCILVYFLVGFISGLGVLYGIIRKKRF